jgi:hypothetical protein
MAEAVGCPTFARMTTEHALTIRVAGPRDDAALLRLAALDDARPLTGRVLLAESGGGVVAAVSLTTGAAIADPFEYTNEAVHLLRLRRYQLLRQGGDVAPARSLLRRLAHGTA